MGKEPELPRRLFLAQTIRHLFLHAGVAARLGDENHLLIVEHFSPGLVEKYTRALENWPDNPFAQVALADMTEPRFAPTLPRLRRYRAKRRWLRAHRRKTRELIDQAIEQGPLAGVFAGYESYESQYAMQAAKRRSPACVGAYVEDGTAAYARSFRKHRSPWSERIKGELRRVRYGLWWEEAEVSGTSRWIDECHLIFPDLALAELRSKRLCQLDATIHRTRSFRGFAEGVAAEFELDTDRLRGAGFLIAVSRSTLLDYLPGYEETVRRLLRRLLDAGERVAVKYHPREPRPNYLGLTDGGGLHLVTPEIPFELLVLLLDDDRATVLGDVSTALLSARWLRPEMRLIALQHALAPEDPAYRFLESEFRTLGIDVETDPTRLAHQLSHADAG